MNHLLRTFLKLINRYPMSWVVEDFKTQHDLVQLMSFKYLSLWFKQTFELPEWKVAFADMPDMHQAMASECTRYLLFAKDNRTKKELKDNKQALLAKKHVKKWARDVMSQDVGYRRVVVQTLRMHLIIGPYTQGGDKYYSSTEYEHITSILTEYGDLVPKHVTPWSYAFLLIKFEGVFDVIDEGKKHE